MHYGKAIQNKLINADLDQVWLAKKLGTTRQAVSFMCSRKHINTAKLHRVCDLLGISIMALMIEGSTD